LNLREGELVNVADLNNICKSSIFKSVLKDLIYSFRMSIKKLTGITSDIKLDKIKISSFYNGNDVLVGKISNIIGGKIGCSIDNSLIIFLSEYTGFDKEYVPLIFVTDYFDCFSSTSCNSWLTLNTNEIKLIRRWDSETSYYISFSVKFLTGEKEVILSKFVIFIDEIASLYFIEK